MTLDLEKLRALGVKSCTVNNDALVSVEFFPPERKPDPMPLDPVSLSKTLTDTMPPDSAMLFAAVDDPAPEKEEG